MNLKLQLSHSKARQFAYNLWGTVNGSYKTNRKGVYYFHCAGHGGYIVDGMALTKPEQELINKDMPPHYTVVSYNINTGENVKMFNPFSFRSHQITYKPSCESYMENYPIYVFEEDCDWSILEHHTDIRIAEKFRENHDESIIGKTYSWLMELRTKYEQGLHDY